MRKHLFLGGMFAMTKKTVTKKERFIFAISTLITVISVSLIMEYFLNNWDPLPLPKWLIAIIIGAIIPLPLYVIMNHLFIKKH